jgi:hypothetical protein
LGWEAFPKEICEANLPKPAKINSFLIEKFLSPALLKIKIFAGFGGRRQPTFRKRWAGLSPCGRTTCLPAGRSKVSIRILFKIGSNFVQKTPPENFRFNTRSEKDFISPYTLPFKRS